MSGGVALSWRGPIGAANVAKFEAFGEDLHQAREHVFARAHVARLLLHPDDLLKVRVASEEFAQVAFGEWVELLYAADRDALVALATLVADKVVVDLPGAEQQPRDLLGWHTRFGQNGVEALLG